jgi:hypothetical protein
MKFQLHLLFQYWQRKYLRPPLMHRHRRLPKFENMSQWMCHRYFPVTVMCLVYCPRRLKLRR